MQLSSHGQAGQIQSWSYNVPFHVAWWAALAISCVSGWLQGELPRWFGSKESAWQCGRCRRWTLDSWVGKIPGVGYGNLLQHSCLENPMDRGPWRATAHGITKSWTQLTPMQADGGMCLLTAALRSCPWHLQLPAGKQALCSAFVMNAQGLCLGP